MYTFVDFTSQIVGWRGVPCPTNKRVSYTNLMCWLDRDLKNKLLLLLLMGDKILDEALFDFDVKHRCQNAYVYFLFIIGYILHILVLRFNKKYHY
jgi:hypothetical protein